MLHVRSASSLLVWFDWECLLRFCFDWVCFYGDLVDHVLLIWAVFVSIFLVFPSATTRSWLCIIRSKVRNTANIVYNSHPKLLVFAPKISRTK